MLIPKTLHDQASACLRLFPLPLSPTFSPSPPIFLLLPISLYLPPSSTCSTCPSQAYFSLLSLEHMKLTPVLEPYGHSLSSGSFSPSRSLLEDYFFREALFSTSSEGDLVTLSYCPIFFYLFMALTLFIGLLSILIH